jgi:hypothetical protein
LLYELKLAGYSIRMPARIRGGALVYSDYLKKIGSKFIFLEPKPTRAASIVSDATR